MSCENELEIRKGDTLPALRVLLSDKDENVPDFTGATAVFVMFDSNKAEVVNAAATLHAPPETDALTGEKFNAQYDWVLADTDRNPGTYKGEFRVTFPSGGTATFPSNRPNRPRIRITSV